MPNKITIEIKKIVADIVKEITGKNIYKVIPQPEKRNILYLKYKDLVTSGKKSPHTAAQKLKEFIVEYEKAKEAIQAMHLMKYEETIEERIPKAENRSKLYIFYIEKGREETIRKYYRFH